MSPLPDPEESLKSGFQLDEESVRLDRAGFFDPGESEASTAGTDITVQAQQPETTRLLNYILGQAVELDASDIHFQPDSEGYLIRMRIDGVLSDFSRPPKDMGPILMARIKVLADMNIAERRLPQDGRLELNHQGRNIEIRVSLIPSVFGESGVLRILSTGMTEHRVSELGLTTEAEERFMGLFQAPHGMILVTGPTGSGKTTTLYAAINELNQMDRKIITTEEPVEYDIKGVIQVEINPNVGLTFASSLRSILRQDPDIILIGEIRDPETARISIQAGLTGHLVLGTVHTRDAPSAVPRLVNMGIEPYLVADTILGIIAQRLVRRTCKNCRVSQPVPAADVPLLRSMGHGDVTEIFLGQGCEQCSSTGYKGRQAIFEILVCEAAICELIHEGASPIELRDLARKLGTLSLRDAGMLLAINGDTTIEEILRTTIDERIDAEQASWTADA